MGNYKNYLLQKISMADRLEKLSGRYALYAYSEGKYIKRARSMKFTGIPVLFVPGHGGSFKQGDFYLIFCFVIFFSLITNKYLICMIFSIYQMYFDINV